MTKEHHSYLDMYKIEGTVNYDQSDAFHTSLTYPGFQSQLIEFKQWMSEGVQMNSSATIYKFGDGDFHFLTKSRVGSAQPGRRAISKDYSALSNHSEFVEGVCKNDIVAVEVYNHNLFHQIYPHRKIDIPAEYGYGLVANRWLTKSFAGSIGLIGGGEKLDLIRRLMEHEVYREFLGLDHFNDYIKVPQKFACDDLDAVTRSVLDQLESADNKTRLYLVGIGHVKSGLLHRLKSAKNAIFYDVGSGIDAIAGVVDFCRPYMGAWTNYRLKSFDYSKIDFLQYAPDATKEIWL